MYKAKKKNKETLVNGTGTGTEQYSMGEASPSLVSSEPLHRLG